MKQRQASLLPATSEVKQRVLSARRLRVKSLQNQLVVAQQHISELTNENRILRTLHKRQDSALAKYVSENAELPQLLRSHAEEIRVWETKYKNLQTFNRELMAKLKQKDSMILNLSDENKHLTQLNNDKNLEERTRLTEKVRNLEERLMEKDKDMRLLARKLELAEKHFKNQLNHEHHRYRELQIKFENLKMNTNERRNHHHCEVNEKITKNPLLPTRVKSYKEIIKDQNCVLHQKDSVKSLHQCNGNHFDRKSESPLSIAIVEESSEIEKKSMGFSKSNSSRTKISAKEVGHSKAVKKRFTEFDLSGDESNITTYDNAKASSSEKKIQDDQEYKNLLHEKKSKENKVDLNGDDHNDDDSTDVYIASNLNGEETTKNNISDSEDEDELIESFKTIHRTISEDYKEKEVLIERFCRESIEQSSGVITTAVAENKEQKRIYIDPKKKSKLLAALKNIDADQGK